MKKFYCILTFIIAFLPLTLSASPAGSVCFRDNEGSGAVSGNDYFTCPKDVSDKKITIPELYTKGYRVTSLNIVVRNLNTSSATIIIEKINLK